VSTAVDSSTPAITDEFLAARSAEFESASAEDVVRWALRTFPDGVFLTASGQRGGIVLIDMVYSIAPDTPVLFGDTGYHFNETWQYITEITARYKLNLTIAKPRHTREEFEKQHGPRLHDRDPNTCCALNKIEPVRREIAELMRRGRRVWIDGRRRSQGDTREKLPVVYREPDGIIKVLPLVKWNTRDLWKYMKERGIPEHPLYARHYTSIGCSPENCTRPPVDPDDERSGRWAGKDKKECGLHFQI
jgi:phosphoadenosine phosphosulfate reductase